MGMIRSVPTGLTLTFLLPLAGVVSLAVFPFFFFTATATTEIYTVRNTLSLHDALPISPNVLVVPAKSGAGGSVRAVPASGTRSEEHTSELQSLRTISYAVFCLKKK